MWLNDRCNELLDELQEELPGDPSKTSLVEEALEDFHAKHCRG